MTAPFPVYQHSPRPVRGRVPAIRRLASLGPISSEAERALMRAATASRALAAPRELTREGRPVSGTFLILAGWAARVRLLEDGRRQIMSVLLPGDLIGHCHQPRPMAVSTVVALSEISYCAAPQPIGLPDLDRVYAISHALEEAHLLAHITRLGRLSAGERMLDLFLELRDRLSICGLVEEGSMAFPLTQEMLADAMGLTPVHVNRTLQLLRRHGDIALGNGRLTLFAPEALALRVGHRVAQVTGHGAEC